MEPELRKAVPLVGGCFTLFVGLVFLLALLVNVFL